MQGLKEMPIGSIRETKADKKGRGLVLEIYFIYTARVYT